MKLIKFILINIVFVQLLRANIDSLEKKESNLVRDKFALVIKPVIDLVGQSCDSLTYERIALSPLNKKDPNSCARIHQMLFNESAKVISDLDQNEVMLELPNLFYTDKNNKLKTTKFRTLKTNLILFDELTKSGIDLSKIANHDINQNSQNLINLMMPFHDKKSGKIYSAGTKFIYEKSNQSNYFAYALNINNLNFEILEIPKKICTNFATDSKLSNNQKILNFVKLIRKWANQKKGYIPYVWGGCSFCNLSNDKNFQEKECLVNNNKLNYYELKNFNQPIKTGLDCSGLVLRATQICGLPFYYKNSTTIANNLRAVKKNEKLSNGDIIWIPGHILVISDINNNLVVEATDYSTGYGRVQEIKVSKLFKGINNFTQLKRAFFQEKPLLRLNKQGALLQTIPKFKLLKLNSIFKGRN